MGIVSSKPERRWPGRRIPFVIDDNDFPPGSPQRMVVQTAINMWNGQTFAPLAARTDEHDYVRFREASANLHSHVGRQGGEQGVYCDIGRSSQKLIPDQKSKAAPALAATPGVLHMIHLGNSSNDLWHSTFDGSPWTTNVKIPDQKSKASPALAFFNGAIHMVHLGDSSNNLWHSVFNGTSWSTNVKIPDQKSKSPPALAEFGGKLHMVHLGDSSNDIWYSAFDGTSWSPNVKIAGQKSKATPALASDGVRLHMVHLGDSSNNLWHSMFDGTSWSPNVQIPGQKSKAAPALAFDGTALHLVHLGDSSNDLWHSQFDGINWLPNFRIAEEKSKASPALATFAGRVHMVHLGDSSNNLWHSKLDSGADTTLAPKVVHEICHAAGVIHEQSREDRDWFVTIDMDEVQDGKEGNYEKRNGEAEDSGLYDYDSVMHYNPFAFAKGATPVMTQGIATSGFTGSFANAGNATGLSAGDIETLFALYPAWSPNVRIPDQGKSRHAGAGGVRRPAPLRAHRQKLKRPVAFHVQRDRLEP